MVATVRLELTTPALWVLCSNQLSYVAKRLQILALSVDSVNSELNIKTEMNHITLLQDIVFAF